MKTTRIIFCLCMFGLGLLLPRAVVAQSSSTPATSPTPPVVALHNNGGLQGLKGIPLPVADLIVSFSAQRDKYLLQQHQLLGQLQNATTPEERETIRQELQDNRQGFMDELADFRQKLKDELKDLSGRISNAEMLRIIAIAQKDDGLGHFRRGH